MLLSQELEGGGLRGESNEFDIGHFPFGCLLRSWLVPKDLGKCIELKVPVGQ